MKTSIDLKENPMRRSPQSRTLILLVCAYFAISLVYWGRGVHDRLSVALHPEQRAANPFDLDMNTGSVTGMPQEAHDAGLPMGARVQTLNGQHYTGRIWNDLVSSAQPGDAMHVGFRRTDGSIGEVELRLPAFGPEIDTAARHTRLFRLITISFAMPLLCLLVGVWVALAKPAEFNAWLLLLLLSFPTTAFLGPVQTSGGWFLFLSSWQSLLQTGVAPVLFLFGIYFPERSRIDVRWPGFKWLLLIPSAASTIVLFLALGWRYLGGGVPPWLMHAGKFAANTINTLGLVFVVLYLVLVIDKLRTASSADARRRLRVLLAGTGTGTAVLLFFFVLLPHLGFDYDKTNMVWLAYIGASIFLIAPFTLAYVVVVQRAMDVRILLRSGTRYALARVTLVVVQGSLIGVIAYRLLSHPALQQDSLLMRVIGPLLFIAFIFFVRLKVRKPMQDWVDRKFFREAYNSEQVLSELSSEARRFTEAAPLLETVARRISETLHVERIGMLVAGTDGFRLQHATGVTAVTNGSGKSLLLRPSSSTIRNLSITNSPARLYRDDPDPWYLMADDLERETLDLLQTELLLPMPGRNRLMGVMALGPKKSEAAYSGSDLHLLQTVATQTGLALEISELATSLATAAAQRERANREIEIAREVQERLFPQMMPVIPGASIAGACRPALGVGGDYYDAFELCDGRIGLAVGDVSGKGISAALLMASLRASLRGLTLDTTQDFASVMEKVNHLVYEASAANRYATFFFAAYDPQTRSIACVNAGHNPPVVLRRRTGGAANGAAPAPDQVLDQVLIHADGPVIGLLPNLPYTEQSLCLQPGDVLLAYTDGISEAMTRDEEEWGEERMIAAAAAVIDQPADVILKCIFDGADKFTAGARQHDDMTLLVLKLEA